MRIDPELQAVLAALPESDYGDLGRTRELGRQRWLAATGGRPPTDPRVEFADRLVGDVRVRIYRPCATAEPAGVYVHLHGGGFVLGNLESDHARLLRFTAAAECTVISVDYRLAPEHPYPSGLDDACTVVWWAAANPAELGAEPGRLVVGGASAGGGLAAGVALAARDRRGPGLVGQLLLYPVLDDRLQTESMSALTDAPVLDRRKCELLWQYYLGEGGGLYAAPARVGDLTRLPPAYLLACEGDPLRDEGLEYARRLAAAGVPVELRHAEGTYHAFDNLAPHTAIGAAALDDQIRWLRAAVGPGG